MKVILLLLSISKKKVMFSITPKLLEIAVLSFFSYICNLYLSSAPKSGSVFGLRFQVGRHLGEM